MALSAKREVKIGDNGNLGNLEDLRTLVELTKDWDGKSRFKVYASTGDPRDQRDSGSWSITVTDSL